MRPRCKFYQGCVRHIFPDDPEAPVPVHGLKSLCHTCYSYISQEQPVSAASLPPQLPESQWSLKQWDAVQQLHAQVKHLDKKLIEHIATPKKPGKGRY